MNELSSHNTGAGKGDFDRSPGWRDHYDEINWPRHFPEGFKRIGPGRLRKRYGTRPSTGVSVENLDTGDINVYTDIATPEGDQSVKLVIAEGTVEWIGRINDAFIPKNPDGTVPAVSSQGETCCGQCGCAEKHD